ncbi:MAG: T9SS type A sorting domain-containing protein [Bacteroidetes bacterium]|nr:T9SS type A sorting domain-containing protein [Bacteroidota bacterium]MBL7103820.1 T9SS type A sorting domain-containing protein [Bacteroidales bacterium]
MKNLYLLLISLLIINHPDIYAQTIPYPVVPDWESAANGHIATGLGLADIDNDGWKDLIVANGNDIQRQHLVVYYNNGDGTFPSSPDWQSDDIDYHGHLSVGDINLDGWVDVAVSVYIGPSGFGDPGKVKVYYNQEGELEGTPSFESYEFYTFSCALGDADGDGDLDLATTGGEPYGSLFDKGKIFINRNGTFSENPEWTTDNDFGSLDVDFGDIDGNGFLDVVFSSEETPNYIFLADDNGNISTSAAWQSSEPSNYINSLDFGLVGSDKTPGVVMTGNSQLGGDGKVRLYDFGSGVPATSSASWSSNPFGYGSGILLADVDLDGILDLIYGGWWLPMKIALGENNGFEMNPSYTSNTSSVVETIQIADLDRDGIQTATETFNINTDGISVIYLEKQLVENIISVSLNGIPVSRSFYCFVINKNWISFKDNLKTGDVIVVEYEYSEDGDIVITNWDSNKGNYIFYNDPTTSVEPGSFISTEEFSIYIAPNPVSDKFTVNYFLPEKALIEIILSDLYGRKAVKTFRKWEQEGKHSVEINTDNLIRGVYNLEFKAGKFTEVGRIVVK